MPSPLQPERTRVTAVRPFLPFSSASALLRPAARAVASLGAAQCRWPRGEPAGDVFAFCDGPRQGRGAYCAAHRRLSRAGA